MAHYFTLMILLTVIQVKSKPNTYDLSTYLEQTSSIDKSEKGGLSSDMHEDVSGELFHPSSESSDCDTQDELPVCKDVSDNEPVHGRRFNPKDQSSGKFEGDIILNKRQRQIILEKSDQKGLENLALKRKYKASRGSDFIKRWPNSEVIYEISNDFTRREVRRIIRAFLAIARESCITFRKRKKGDKGVVYITGHESGCFSNVGYQGDSQLMNLSSGRWYRRGNNCFKHGVIIHEMLHTLGFLHMHSSAKRDQYIDIIWRNIRKVHRKNFRKYHSYSVTNYDYNSILHYSKRAFSKNGRPTIVPKKRVVIGQRMGLSKGDIKRLNHLYCKDSRDWLPGDDSDAGL